MLIAGLGAINKGAKNGATEFGKKTLIKLTQQYLKGATLTAAKEVFKRVGITFTRKAVEKAIPFGAGMVISFSANKSLTAYVGNRAKRFFEPTE